LPTIAPDVLLDALASFSFPSGHSSAAFAFFLVLAARSVAANRRAHSGD
jgi:membrane-associated phospholipid phosphatase